MTETDIDLQGIAGDAEAADRGVLYGAELMAFATAVAGGTDAELNDAREALFAAGGAAVLVDAAGVAANFQRMVRIADATGIPVDNLESEVGQSVRAELNLEVFPSAVNSGL